MQKIQVVVIAVIVCWQTVVMAQSSNCALYQFFGEIAVSAGSEISLLVHPGSKSQITVKLTDRMQKSFKRKLNTGVELITPAIPKSPYLYEAYFNPAQTKIYPAESSPKKEGVKLLKMSTDCSSEPSHL